MFSRFEKVVPGEGYISGRERAWRAIMRWAGFQANHIPLYFFLALIVYFLADIAMLGWAVWFVLQFSGTPEVPVPM